MCFGHSSNKNCNNYGVHNQVVILFQYIDILPLFLRKNVRGVINRKVGYVLWLQNNETWNLNKICVHLRCLIVYRVN